MNQTDIQCKVSILCIDGILNCFKEKTIIGKHYDFGNLNPKSNLDFLRFYWSLNEDVEKLADIIVNNPRRLTTSIIYEEHERNGNISGTINAGKTVLAQARTLDPTLFIVNEPTATYYSEPNILVAWVLNEALDLLLSARRTIKRLDKLKWYNEKITLLETALKNDVLQDIIFSPLGKKRPSSAVLRSASKSRVPTYVLAVKLYYLLVDIEDGDKEAIIKSLSNTLVADLEYWQRLELGSALQAAVAISEKIKEPIRLSFPFVTGSPIARIGPYKIYWQYSIKQRDAKNLDLSERWTREIATNIGVRIADSRADVVITYKDELVSLFECKYFESKSSISQAVLDASSQLVRYSRDLYPYSINDAEKFLERCHIIVAHRNKYKGIYSSSGTKNRTVYFLDVHDISNNLLDTWASELITFCSGLGS